MESFVLVEGRNSKFLSMKDPKFFKNHDMFMQSKTILGPFRTFCPSEIHTAESVQMIGKLLLQ